jgi:hypothetical protein
MWNATNYKKDINKNPPISHTLEGIQNPSPLSHGLKRGSPGLQPHCLPCGMKTTDMRTGIKESQSTQAVVKYLLVTEPMKNLTIANSDTFVLLSNDCIDYCPCVWGGGGGCYHVIFCKILSLGFFWGRLW